MYEELKKAAKRITTGNTTDLMYDCFGEWKARQPLFRAAREGHNSPALLSIGMLRYYDRKWGELCNRTDIKGDKPWPRRPND